MQILNAEGRWLSPDPLGGDITNPQSRHGESSRSWATLNRYAYVLNNPTTLTDPSGLCGGCKLYEPPNLEGYDPFSLIGVPVRAGTVLVSTEDGLYEVGGPLIGNGLILGGIFGGSSASGGGINFLGGVRNAGPFGGTTIYNDFLQAPKNGCAVNATSLDMYLQGKGSPMTGEGSVFLNAGNTFNVDPRFIVALAGAETTFGRNITSGQYNAWNWRYNGSNSPFSSWAAGIGTVTGRIALDPYYFQAGRTNTSSFYHEYCTTGTTCSAGLANLNSFLEAQGGNPGSLTFPCDGSN